MSVDRALDDAELAEVFVDLAVVVRRSWPRLGDAERHQVADALRAVVDVCMGPPRPVRPLRVLTGGRS